MYLCRKGGRRLTSRGRAERADGQRLARNPLNLSFCVQCTDPSVVTHDLAE